MIYKWFIYQRKIQSKFYQLIEREKGSNAQIHTLQRTEQERSFYFHHHKEKQLFQKIT